MMTNIKYVIPGFFLCLILLFGCLQPYSEAAPEPPTQNETKEIEQQINETKPKPVENKTEEKPPEEKNDTPGVLPKEPVIQKTNLSLTELMKDKLDSLDAPMGGPFFIVENTWISNELEADDSAITLNPTMHILFDTETEKNLVGFAFKTYEPSEGGTTTAKGVAITVNESNILEQKMIGTFGIDYNVPGFEKTLYGCSMTSKDKFVNEQGKVIVIYGFNSISVD